MGSIRFKEVDVKNMLIIKEKGAEHNIFFKSNSQIIRKALDYTAKYWNPTGE